MLTVQPALVINRELCANFHIAVSMVRWFSVVATEERVPFSTKERTRGVPSLLLTFEAYSGELAFEHYPEGGREASKVGA